MRRGQHDRPQTDPGIPPVLRVDEALRSSDLHIQAMGRILDQLTWLVPAHIATFYTVGEHLEKYAAGPVVARVSRALSVDLEQSLPYYLEHYAARDPFAPSRLPDPQMALATPEDLGSTSEWYVREVASTFALTPTANLYLRAPGGRIVAGICMGRQLGAPVLSPSEIAVLRRVHGYVQFTYVVCARLSAQNGNAHALEARLTARERDVFALLQHGESYEAIGRDLGISHATVKTHLKHTFKKLGVANRYEAMVAVNSDTSLAPNDGPPEME